MESAFFDTMMPLIWTVCGLILYFRKKYVEAKVAIAKKRIEWELGIFLKEQLPHFAFAIMATFMLNIPLADYLQGKIDDFLALLILASLAYGGGSATFWIMDMTLALFKRYVISKIKRYFSSKTEKVKPEVDSDLPIE